MKIVHNRHKQNLSLYDMIINHLSNIHNEYIFEWEHTNDTISVSYLYMTNKFSGIRSLATLVSSNGFTMDYDKKVIDSVLQTIDESAIIKILEP